MPVTLDAEEHLGWFSPVERGVLPLDGMRVSRSLRRSARDFEIRIDTAFDEVVAACGSPDRADGWITPDFRHAYGRLHRLGWAHSVEAWRDGRLAGGLYGVSVGGLFAGESMFHRERDASKVALLALVDLLSDQHADRRRARRAVADPAPGLARRRTPSARGVPRVARGAPATSRCRLPSGWTTRGATREGRRDRDAVPTGDASHEGEPMTIRTRLTLTSAVLLVGAVTSACGGGGGGAPSDASKDGFCETARPACSRT